MTISFWAWLPLLTGLLIWLSRLSRKPSPRPVGWSSETIEDRITIEENGVVFPGKNDLEWQILHLERTIHENDRELQQLLDSLQQEFPTPTEPAAECHVAVQSASDVTPGFTSVATAAASGRSSAKGVRSEVSPAMEQDSSRQLITIPVSRPPATSRREAGRHWPVPRGRLLQMIRHRSSAALLPLLKGVASTAKQIRRWCSRGLLHLPSDLLSKRIPALFESGKIRPSHRFFPMVRHIPAPSQLQIMERFLTSNRHSVRKMGIAFALKLGRIELNDSLISAIQIQDQELLGRAQRVIESEARLGSDPQELHRWITRVQSLPADQAFGRLARLSRHPQSFVRAAILRTLTEYDRPDVFPLLEAAARDTEYEVRLTGIAGLGRFGLRGQEILLAALEDKSSEVILTAIKTLSDIGCAKALPLLEPLARSTHPSIRFFAAHAIGQIRNTL